KGLRVLKARRVRLPADLLPAGAGLKRLHHVRHAGGGRGQLPGPLAVEHHFPGGVSPDHHRVEHIVHAGQGL
ncbi:HTH-type transcriptional regulator immR, partial [Dysosmobacter welbionis]